MKSTAGEPPRGGAPTGAPYPPARRRRAKPDERGGDLTCGGQKTEERRENHAVIFAEAY